MSDAMVTTSTGVKSSAGCCDSDNRIVPHIVRKCLTMVAAICWQVVFRVNSYVEGKRNPSRDGACGSRSEISDVLCAAAKKSGLLQIPCRWSWLAISYI